MHKLTSALVGTVVVAGSAMLGTGTAEAIVGGTTPTQPYLSTGSLQDDEHGIADWHRCGVTLIDPWHVETNAHCVTNPPATEGSASAASTRTLYASWLASNTQGGINYNDPGRYHVRIGSADRESGGEVRHLTQFFVPTQWNWGQTDPDGRQWDIAIARLDRPVFDLPPAIIHHTQQGQPAREIGWGYTNVTQRGSEAPRYLSQLDVHVLPKDSCAVADIGPGEICLGGATNASPCNGDSGTTALQTLGHRRAVMIGSASRTTTPGCGDPGENVVYTDPSDQQYRDWIIRAIFGLPDGASTTGHDLATANA